MSEFLSPRLESSPLQSPELRTRRLMLRRLEPSDATQTYLDWFADPAVQRFIAAAREPQSLDSLREFIQARRLDPRSLLIGIFEQRSQVHIGNIKYEPVDLEKRRAIMGVLIGSPEWRGKSVFSEAFEATANWLSETHGIREFWLGVERENAAAVISYQRAGFVEARPPADLFGDARVDCLYMLRIIDV